jgi:hypothetical protein
MHSPRRPGFLTTMALVVSLSTIASAFPQDYQSQQRSIVERLMQRGRVINILDDFLAFWDQTKTLSPSRQRSLFRRVIESRYRDYFEKAVYRGADRRQRRALLDEFLVRVPERIDAMREFNRQLADPSSSPLIDAVVNFRIWFREFSFGSDIYIGLSFFSFDGAIRSVGNDQGIPDTLCLGADVLARYSKELVRLTVTHELFHLYHFSFLFGNPSIEDFQSAHIPLMVEGMAVAATEQLYPNLSDELYLHFSSEQLASQKQGLRREAASFLQLILAGAPPEAYDSWFSGYDAEVPVRGGYLLGQEVVRRLLSTYTLEQLVRMTPAELRVNCEESLADIAGVRVMFVSTTN